MTPEKLREGLQRIQELRLRHAIELEVDRKGAEVNRLTAVDVTLNQTIGKLRADIETLKAGLVEVA